MWLRSGAIGSQCSTGSDQGSETPRIALTNGWIKLGSVLLFDKLGCGWDWGGVGSAGVGFLLRGQDWREARAQATSRALLVVA